MFGNRYTVETKIVKKSKENTNPEIEAPEAPVKTDFVQLVRENAELIAKTVVISVGSYVLLDTVRQVAVKITPQH